MGAGSVAIAWTIAGIFILLGSLLPFIQAEFGETVTQYDASGIADPSGATSITIVDVGLSILSMFFWTFGAVNIYIDLLLLILRIGFILAMIDIIWIG